MVRPWRSTVNAPTCASRSSLSHVAAEPIELVVDRLVDLHLIEQMRSALEVEPETDGLLPWPPARQRADEGGQQQDHGDDA